MGYRRLGGRCHRCPGSDRPRRRSLGLESTPASREAQGWVNMNDYIRQVLLPLPERAAVWGSLYFGLEAGDRTDLVQFQQAFNPALDVKLERRDQVVPDFLALGGYEVQDAAALTFIDQDSALGNFFLIFPDARYRVVKIVAAPPYGTTVVYERITGGEVDDARLPAVAVN